MALKAEVKIEIAIGNATGIGTDIPENGIQTGAEVVTGICEIRVIGNATGLGIGTGIGGIEETGTEETGIATGRGVIVTGETVIATGEIATGEIATERKETGEIGTGETEGDQGAGLCVVSDHYGRWRDR